MDGGNVITNVTNVAGNKRIKQQQLLLLLLQPFLTLCPRLCGWADTRRINHYGLYWSKDDGGGSIISWTMCKSFALRSTQMTRPTRHHVTREIGYVSKGNWHLWSCTLEHGTLPLTVSNSSLTLNIFKQKLKMHLFGQWQTLRCAAVVFLWFSYGA